MSDKLKEWAKDHIILETITGSQLYGTATPESDEDFIGIFMPPAEYVFGLKLIQEMDLSVVVKDENGKNTAEAIDRKLYEFRKFINLALNNNPNIMEILYTKTDKIIQFDDIGTELLSIRDAFPSQQCIPRFIGYANAQKHKMLIRREHFHELQNGYDFLGLCDPKLTMGQVYDNQERYMRVPSAGNVPFEKKETGMHIHCGDICFEPGIYAKKASKMLKERLDKVTNRSELVLKHGFDTKFGSHLIRLLYEGLMLLERGELIFPLPMASLLLDIRNGKWELGQVIEHANKLEERFEDARAKTKLPKKANYKKVEEFTIKSMRYHLN